MSSSTTIDIRPRLSRRTVSMSDGAWKQTTAGLLESIGTLRRLITSPNVNPVTADYFAQCIFDGEEAIKAIEAAAQHARALTGDQDTTCECCGQHFLTGCGALVCGDCVLAATLAAAAENEQAVHS